MAIKYKISKTAYEKLSDDLKEAYKADGDNYVIDGIGMPEPEGAGELKRALERVRSELDDTKDELKTVTTERDEIKRTMSDSDRDVAKLTKRHESKINDIKADYEGKLSARDKIILDKALESAASELANKISTSPAVLRPHIVGRLHAELDDTLNPVIKVKDATGKIDDKLTVDKLGEEFVANKEFSAIIRGTQASGGRASTSLSSKPPAVPLGEDGRPKNLMAMTPEERLAHVKAIREERSTT